MTSDKANHRFLLSELIRRDFIKKYKRTTFGILWSALSPLFLLLTMDVVFGTFFGRNMPHYTIYLFCGLLLFTIPLRYTARYPYPSTISSFRRALHRR